MAQDERTSMARPAHSSGPRCRLYLRPPIIIAPSPGQCICAMTAAPAAAPRPLPDPAPARKQISGGNRSERTRDMEAREKSRQETSTRSSAAYGRPSRLNAAHLNEVDQSDLLLCKSLQLRVGDLPRGRLHGRRQLRRAGEVKRAARDLLR